MHGSAMFTLFAPLLLAAAAPTLSCTVTDGDTIRCDKERVRLIGIDAPELPGHCRPNRQCAEGDGAASTAALAQLVHGKPVLLERRGTDHYGRTLAFARVGRVDLSCAQLRAGHAIYVARWDSNGRIRDCRR